VGNHRVQHSGWPARDVIVIGASVGGVEALPQLSAGLSANLPAAIFIVLHALSHSRSLLSDILNRAGPVPAAHAVDGEKINPGRIYIAPPDNGLAIKDGYMCVKRGPQENGHRPAVDPLFRTAAGTKAHSNIDLAEPQ
jgi:two-component system, chemotaxis family, protein-glutamate methylesterase/glutaminase